MVRSGEGTGDTNEGMHLSPSLHLPVVQALYRHCSLRSSFPLSLLLPPHSPSHFPLSFQNQDELLQRHAARALAIVIHRSVDRRPSPNDKLVRNVASLLCSDPSETPPATEANQDDDEPNDGVAVNNNGNNNKAPIGAEVGVGSKGGENVTKDERQRIEGWVSRRGSEAAIGELAGIFGEKLLVKLPRLWELLTEVWRPAGAEGSFLEGAGTCVEGVENAIARDVKALGDGREVMTYPAQTLISSFQVVAITRPLAMGYATF